MITKPALMHKMHHALKVTWLKSASAQITMHGPQTANGKIHLIVRQINIKHMHHITITNKLMQIITSVAIS